MCVLSSSVMSDSSQPDGLWPSRLLSIESSRQEYWSGLLFPLPGDLPDPGAEPASPALAGGFSPRHPLGSPVYIVGSAGSSLQHSVWAEHGCRALGLQLLQPAGLVARSGIRPTSPTLEGRFLATGAPGKSPIFLFIKRFHSPKGRKHFVHPQVPLERAPSFL